MTLQISDAGPVWWGYLNKCTAFLMLYHRLPSPQSDEQSEFLLANWVERQRATYVDPDAYARQFGPHKCDALRDLFSQAESLQLAFSALSTGSANSPAVH